MEFYYSKNNNNQYEIIYFYFWYFILKRMSIYITNFIFILLFSLQNFIIVPLMTKIFLDYHVTRKIFDISSIKEMFLIFKVINKLYIFFMKKKEFYIFLFSSSINFSSLLLSSLSSCLFIEEILSFSSILFSFICLPGG